jgi:hypothetical protein
MSRRLSPLRFLFGLAAIVAIAFPVVPALGQTTGTSTTRVEIDSPAEGATVTNGTQLLIGGWAADPAGPGTGVDAVRIYLDGPMDTGGRLLGNATIGVSRPDVASSTGNPAYATAGFNYPWTPSGLSGGAHTLYVYAHTIATDTWTSKTVTVTTPGPAFTPTPTGPPVATPPAGGYPPGYPPGGYPQGGAYMNPGASGSGVGMQYPYDLYTRQPGYQPGYPGGGYPGGSGYPPPGYGYPPPPYPGYPGYPGYPSYPGNPGQPCIMIYPPPPGC